MLSMAGLNFGDNWATPSGVVGAAYCLTSAWSSATTVLCTASPTLTYTRGLSVIMNWRSLTGTHVDAITFDGKPLPRQNVFIAVLRSAFQAHSSQAPVVSGFDRPNAAATASTAITVAGINFVISDWTVSMRMQPSICATQSWIANTAVKCEVGTPGFGTGFSVALTIAGTLGTLLASFSFDGSILCVWPKMLCKHQYALIFLFGSARGVLLLPRQLRRHLRRHCNRDGRGLWAGL